MPSIRDSLDQAGQARAGRFLLQAGAEALTGAVRVSGRPGGVLYLRHGLVVAAVSPGAPGVQALLMRAGRIGDESEARAGGVDRAAIGAARLRVVQVMATQDALFAMLAGSIDTCLFDDRQDVPSGDGEEPAELLRTAFRKLEALAALERAILPHRERLAPLLALPASGGGHDDRGASSGSAGTGSGALRENILRYADGRHTARDIAFLSGRGLYAVTVEMSRMLGEGILHEPPAPPAPPPGQWSEDLPPHLAPRLTPPASPDDDPPARSDPSRHQPATEPARDAAAQKAATFWRGFLRLGGRAGESRT